jgi:hypothetical protein
MILENGDVVLVSTRRMFERDETRFFLGRTLASDGPLVKIEGFTFVRDLSNGHIVKKAEKRVKILSLSSSGYIVYQLPNVVDLEAVAIESCNGDAFLVDGSRRLLNLAERTHSGHF